jgi:hypothetical protein
VVNLLGLTRIDLSFFWTRVASALSSHRLVFYCFLWTIWIVWLIRAAHRSFVEMLSKRIRVAFHNCLWCQWLAAVISGKVGLRIPPREGLFVSLSWFVRQSSLTWFWIELFPWELTHPSRILRFCVSFGHFSAIFRSLWAQEQRVCSLKDDLSWKHFDWRLVVSSETQYE